MPKLKTHVLTTFTGATKNLFGVVPGFAKGVFHARMRNVTHFALMLLDITSLVKPSLVLMDAVVGMEGDGPSTGPLRDVGVILASRDSVALDAVATSMVGLEPLKVPTLREAVARGLWTGNVEDIETLGASVDEVLVPDFQPPVASPREDATMGNPFFTRHFGPLITAHFTLKPVPQRGRCVACGDCVAGCPQQVITIVDSLAVIDYSQCIRCYCCHELCTEGAIDLERSWLGGLVHRVSEGR
jgi:ferredoxin